MVVTAKRDERVLVSERDTRSTTGNERKLTRSREHNLLGGVCGGVAESFGWSPALVRILFVISWTVPGPSMALYLLLWFIVPIEPKRSGSR